MPVRLHLILIAVATMTVTVAAIAPPALSAPAPPSIGTAQMWVAGPSKNVATVLIDFSRAPSQRVDVYVGGDVRSNGSTVVSGRVIVSRSSAPHFVGQLGLGHGRFVVGRTYRVLVALCRREPAKASDGQPTARAAKGRDCRFLRTSASLLASKPTRTSPGAMTTERTVHVRSLLLERLAADRVRVRIAFDRVPRGLTQVDVGGDGRGFLGTVVEGTVNGHRFTGEYSPSSALDDFSQRVFIVFCRARPGSRARSARGPETPVARAAKGNCTWIATGAVLQPTFG